MSEDLWHTCPDPNCQEPGHDNLDFEALERALIDPEPAPIQNQHPAVWDLVIADMRARDQFGYDKYQTRLQPHNGRKSLRDAYQEALDLCAYLRQELYEREGK